MISQSFYARGLCSFALYTAMTKKLRHTSKRANWTLWAANEFQPAGADRGHNFNPLTLTAADLSPSEESSLVL